MNLNEYTLTMTSIFISIEKIIKKLKSAANNPDWVILSRNNIERLETLNEQVSLLNKFHPFSYPSHYSDDEKEQIYSLIKLADNHLASINSSVLSEEIYYEISNISDDLIKYARISRLIQETDNQSRDIDLFQKKIADEIAKISDLKNQIELNSNEIREIVSINAEANDKLLKLVSDVRSESKRMTVGGAEIEHILQRSKEALIDIESTNETIHKTESSLKKLVDDNTTLHNNIILTLDDTKSEVKTLLNKKEEIEKLKKSISAEIAHSQELQSKAKAALNLAGTYRLSRHFKKSYETANKNKLLWAGVSIIFALACMAFMCFMLYKIDEVSSYKSTEQGSHLLLLFFARFSMLPVLIGFFAFSAIQYVKQNNIAEDYAHKKLLSETLVSFKQEINKNDTDKTSIFMDKILKTVLSSPLNSVDKKSHKVEIEKINQLIESTSKSCKEIIDQAMPKNKEQQ